jgi:eukaryotic-like serine/threonine-protein kinase
MIMSGRGKHEGRRARPSRIRSVAGAAESTAPRGRGAVVVSAAIVGLAAAVTVVVGVVAGVVAI